MFGKEIGRPHTPVNDHPDSPTHCTRIGNIAKNLAIALTLTAVALFLATVRYSTDPFELSPLGSVTVLVTSLLTMVIIYRRLRRLSLDYWRPAATAILLFSSFQAGPSGIASRPLGPIIAHNAQMLGNHWAWRAALDVDLTQGLRGIAPLFFRPLVAGHSVSLVAVPGATLGTYKAIAVSTPDQVVPIQASLAIWHTLPARSLPVTNAVLLSQTGRTRLPSSLNADVLARACTSCFSQIHFVVNPDYLQKMAWNFTKLVAVGLPIRSSFGLLSSADLMTFAEVGDIIANDPSANGQQLASAKLGAWLAGSGASLAFRQTVGSDSVLSLAGSHVGQLPSAAVKQALVPSAVRQPQWSWMVARTSGGTLPVNGSTVSWNASLMETYKGTNLNDGWDSTRVTQIRSVSVPLPKQSVHTPLQLNRPQVRIPDSAQFTGFSPRPTWNLPHFTPSVHNIQPIRVPSFTMPRLNSYSFDLGRFSAPTYSMPRYISPAPSLPRFNAASYNLPRYTPPIHNPSAHHISP